MNVDGSDVRRVTHRLGYDGGAFFSPDGRHLVWRAMYPETAADSADYRRLLDQRLVRPTRLELWVLRRRRRQRAAGHPARRGQLRAVFPSGRPADHVREQLPGARAAGTSTSTSSAWTAAGSSG